jgi:thiol-disulfide isomerase/thioredoxin
MPIALRKFPRVLAALVAVLWVAVLSASAAAGVKAGDTFPDLAPFKLEGKLPESLKDKVVMIDFWASWCDPCKDSFPAMEDLHKRYASQGLVIIAVNVDEVRADMDDFLKKNRATFTIVRDASQKLVEKAGASTMPTSFLIDRAGKVRFVHSGYHGDDTKKKYEQQIEQLLKK